MIKHLPADPELADDYRPIPDDPELVRRLGALGSLLVFHEAFHCVFHRAWRGRSTVETVRTVCSPILKRGHATGSSRTARASLASAETPSIRPMTDPREFVRRYFAALEGDDVSALDALLDPEVVQREWPNTLNPRGGVSDRATLLARFARRASGDQDHPCAAAVSRARAARGRTDARGVASGLQKRAWSPKEHVAGFTITCTLAGAADGS